MVLLLSAGIYLRHCLDNRQDEYEFMWPSKLTSLPYVRRRPGYAQKSKQNGAAANGINGTSKKNL